MSKNIKLLLTESVDSIGIVGDVVNVRMGFARNFLLPRNMATTPTEEAIKAVATKRADAEKQLAELRKQREALVKKIEGIELTIQRSCNDLGHLYASVTQQEIAKALEDAGHKGVKARDVRLHQNIKRVDTYDIHIKFEADLEATIKLWVVADRKLDLDKRAEADAEAQAADKANEKSQRSEEKTEEAPSDEAGERSDKPGKGDKASKSDKAPKGDRPQKDDKKSEGASGDDKPRKKSKGKDGEAGAPAAAEEPKKSGWGKPVEKPSFDDLGVRRPRRDRDDKKKG